jgi:serine/threonine-protein kinase PpkA
VAPSTLPRATPARPFSAAAEAPPAPAETDSAPEPATVAPPAEPLDALAADGETLGDPTLESTAVTVIDPLAPVDPAAQRLALLDLAAADLKAGRLALPRGANAFERYAELLKVDPADADALAGLDQVVSRYLGMAERARSQDKLEQIAPLVERARQVAQSNPALDPAAKRIDAFELALTQALREPADAALSAKKKPDAEAAYARWLRAQPQSTDAKAGLAAAQAIVIPPKDPSRHALKSGGDGPALKWITINPGGRESRLGVAVNEVTVAEFEKFLSASGWAAKRDGRLKCEDRAANFSFRRRTFSEPGFEQTRDAPVVCVSHADADAYAAWLSQETGQRYRLPNADEWSAIALKTVVVGPPSCARGNLADQSLAKRERNMAHLDCDDRFAATAPVRAFGGSGPGLYGMVGNVREWVGSCSGKCAALGTGWASGPSEDLIAERRQVDAAAAANDIGFRMVVEPAAAR